MLPTGTMELVINLRDDNIRVYDRKDTDQYETHSRAVITGAHKDFFVIDTAQQNSIMGVHFRPGGAFPFLKPPADELHNMHVSLETPWGAPAGELRDRLLEADTPQVKFRILEQALLRPMR